MMQPSEKFEYAGPQTGWTRLVDGAAIPVSRWNEGDVSAWLQHLGLSSLVEPFKALNVDGPTLLNMTPEDVQNVALPVRLTFLVSYFKHQYRTTSRISL